MLGEISASDLVSKPFTEYFLRKKQYSVFFYRCASTSNPPNWPESITLAIMLIKLSAYTKSGRVLIELSEEQSDNSIQVKEHNRATKNGLVHVRAHWRRRPTKP